MAGQLDSLFKNAAKSVVSTLGSALDTSITYTKKTSGSYNTSTGVYTTTDTSYSINVPIEFIQSEEDEGKEIRRAKLYITPDLIGDNQVDFDDEITLSYAGSNVTAQIYDLDTKKGGQVYLYTILVRF
tara:strand:- start:135 stop:518 length:384 start_codon:yes stop_codon:yes gene_type:complete